MLVISHFVEDGANNWFLHVLVVLFLQGGGRKTVSDGGQENGNIKIMGAYPREGTGGYNFRVTCTLLLEAVQLMVLIAVGCDLHSKVFVRFVDVLLW